jgi:hypothetical protein
MPAVVPLSSPFFCRGKWKSGEENPSRADADAFPSPPAQSKNGEKEELLQWREGREERIVIAEGIVRPRMT